ncbi:MAG: YggT family protein [Acidimicrobiales bacterium]
MGIVCLAISIYMLVILVRIVLTWFPLDPNGAMATVAGFLFVITDPVLGPLRRALPPVRLGSVALDLSPIIVLIGLQILQGVVC